MRLLIFDSHPVQYKAPVYQALQRIKPDSFEVIYVSDCSVRGHVDAEFGQKVSWDMPLMKGYEYIVLNNERGTPLSGFWSLHGRGIFKLLRHKRPHAILISQFMHAADYAAYLSALLLRIPIWVRPETNDEAIRRPSWRRILQRIFWRIRYLGVSHAFYIGELNRRHLLRHGFRPEELTFAPYCVASTVPAMSHEEKTAAREKIRARFGVAADAKLILFSGKLIEKKNPQLLIDALTLLPENFHLLYVGAGELQNDLASRAAQFPGRVHFAGFVNQSDLSGYYLAADIFVLPSRRMGETWGLVVNEALHAGCAVVMTDAVGCHADFEGWERVRVIPDGDAKACAGAIRELASYPRSFDWCADEMKRYSVEAAAEALASRL